MNKTLKLALSAVLGVALVTPALAQDNFPDVPQNHWAYQALSSLKDKVLFGYPDGFYRGSRFTSRYELAAALDKIWKAMMAQFDGVNAKIARLESMVGTTGSDAGLQKQIDDLKNELNGMRSWRGDIDTLQRLTREFQSELQQLGVDVNEMKDQISDLDGRLTALENRKGIDVGIEANVLVLAGHSSEGNFGLTQDGRVTGVGAGSYAGLPVGMDKDLNIYHDNYITLNGGKEGEPQFEGVLLVSNLFNDFGGLGGFNFGSGFDDSGDETIGLVKAAVSFNSELLGQGFHAEIGRVGHQVGRYLLKRIAYTEDYYDQDFRNNGDYIFDGGVLGFNFGGVDLTVFGGRNSDRNLGFGSADINPIPFGSGNIDRTLGVQVRFPIGDRGGASLAYLWQDSDNVIADANPYAGGLQPANRLNVYGADVDFTFSNIKFYGSFAQSVLSENTSNALDDDNTAWDVRLGYDSDRWGIVGGYRTIEANFFAAGDWGRVGTWYNPTNVEGFNAMVYFKPSDELKIYGKGEFLEGNDDSLPGYLSEDDKVTSYTIGLEYRLNNMFDLGLKYENNDFDFDGGIPDPYQRWYTVMLGYNFSSNSKIMFTYSYSDADGKGIGVPGMPGTGRFRGGLFGTQLKISF